MAIEVATDLTGRVKIGLRQFIESKGLKPGDKLPTSEELCDQFSVSRTVVREAIASLKAEGKLRSLRGSGVYVSAPAPSAGSPFEFMASPQDIAGVLDFMEFRIAVETEAAALAAVRRTETDILLIERTLIQVRPSDSHLASDAEADRAFHRAVAVATNNRRFPAFVDNAGERLIPRRALGAGFADHKSRSEFLEVIAVEHRRILEAIGNRDAEQARNAMRNHLEDGRRRYREWSLAHGPSD